MKQVGIKFEIPEPFFGTLLFETRKISFFVKFAINYAECDYAQFYKLSGLSAYIYSYICLIMQYRVSALQFATLKNYPSNTLLKTN